MTTVTVDARGHTFDRCAERTHSRATEIVQATLMRAHITKGAFTIAPKNKQRWKSGKNDSMCLRPGQGREIRIRVKTTGNDSVWDYAMMPADAATDFEFVRQMLEAYLGPEYIEDGGESLNSEPGLLPGLPLPQQPKPVEAPVAHTPLQTIQEKPSAAPVVPGDPLAALAKLQTALERQKTRQGQITTLKATIADIELNIKRLQDEKEQAEMSVFELEDANTNDKEIALANQFATLLAQLK